MVALTILEEISFLTQNTKSESILYDSHFSHHLLFLIALEIVGPTGRAVVTCLVIGAQALALCYMAMCGYFLRYWRTLQMVSIAPLGFFFIIWWWLVKKLLTFIHLYKNGSNAGYSSVLHLIKV